MAVRRKSSTKKKTRRFPKGVQVQSLIFDSNQFSAREARSWASEHGFKAPATDRGPTTLRLRQKSPRSFDENTFRTIALRGGVNAVVASPKKKTKK
jgi:hypothetical protein